MTVLFSLWFTFMLLQTLQSIVSSWKSAAMPPLPILPLPSASQLKWQQREIIMFHHFGVNTFTDSEWGTGEEDPTIFNPTALNANQWVDAAMAAGVSLMILTAKHHDGFCLWPSKYTDHSVMSSPWSNGKGDVVREYVEAARKRGVDIGLYLSPWDRHEQKYGQEILYNEYYLGQLQELLTEYGSVQEIWFDGAKGENAPNMSYYFSHWFSMVKELQGSINIFSNAGPDVRWIGDEKGYAGKTCWSIINGSTVTIGGTITSYLNEGDPRGTNWMPAECDVSIRTGWFWHKSETPKALSELLEIYYNSVGRNCVLLLNVPPNTAGLISEADILRLGEFRKAIDTIFAVNNAVGSLTKANSQRGSEFGSEKVLDGDHLWTYWAPEASTSGEYWIEFAGGFRFNVVRIQEAIGLGQRIKVHEVYADGKLIASGTTVGHKRLHRLDGGVINARTVRIIVKDSRAVPLISSFGLHIDPYWHPK